MEHDIRWKQRFSNFEKALSKLKEIINIYELSIVKEQNNNPISLEILKAGLIKSFEFTHELAWNVMKDYAHYQGNFEVKGSRDAIKEAFQLGLITVAEYAVWSAMIESRNQTAHTYDEELANSIVFKITDKYIYEFLKFYNVMQIKIIEDKISIGLPDVQVEKIIKIFSKYTEVESAIVFGSRAKGNYKYNSDIDIAIKGDVSLTLKNNISNDLDELDMPFKIDLIIFNNIDNQDLIEHIERVGISLYSSDKPNKYIRTN